jgi:hypothetical protein
VKNWSHPEGKWGEAASSGVCGGGGSRAAALSSRQVFMCAPSAPCVAGGGVSTSVLEGCSEPARGTFECGGMANSAAPAAGVSCAAKPEASA